MRFNILCDDFKTYGNMVINKLEEFVTENKGYKIADDNNEGLRVCTENGWFLLRLSVHDPVMAMNFESRVIGGIETDILKIRSFLEQFTQLDISAL